MEGLSFVPFVHNVSDQIACDLDDVGTLVGCSVVSGENINCVCFVHTSMMTQILGFCSSWGYKTQRENLKVACANLPTGQAADLGVINCSPTKYLKPLPSVVDNNDLPLRILQNLIHPIQHIHTPHGLFHNLH